MVFSSISFLYYFLPVFLVLYFLTPVKYRNITLLIGNLLFYFYGEQRYFYIIILMGLINYLIGNKLSKSKSKFILTIGILINILVLFYFKYYDFFVQNFNNIFGFNISFLNIIIPLGISFFTFKNISYIADIYNGKIQKAKNLFYYLTYLVMFPSLVQGPIVKYETVSEELEKRSSSFNLFSKGVSRFVIGLSKKVILADTLGKFISSLSLIESQTVLSAWLKAICDITRLYLDFSGYSDMAIGLGLMLGFHFLENFNYPFCASSLTDFWRRWHISLSSFFKDYIYIPLGGSRVNKFRKYLNIFIVWFVTGLWHGASWNFILWGLYFGIFLVIEKKLFYKFFQKHKILGNIWTNILVIIGFVMFYQYNISDITKLLGLMFGKNASLVNIETIYYLKNYLVLLIISFICCTPLIKNVILKLRKNKKWNVIINILEPISYVVLLIICTSFIIDASSSPFLYFRF